MKFLSNKIFWFLFLAFLFLLFYGLRQYYKPHINIAKSTAEYKLSVDDLLDKYISNETLAEKEISGKIIEVSGVVKEISLDETKNIIVLKGNDANVICHLQKSEIGKIQNIKENTKIIIRGNCSGFLLDVMLTDCIIIN